jgi:hypothetical protein
MKCGGRIVHRMHPTAAGPAGIHRLKPGLLDIAYADYFFNVHQPEFLCRISGLFSKVNKSSKEQQRDLFLVLEFLVLEFLVLEFSVLSSSQFSVLPGSRFYERNLTVATTSGISTLH